MILHTHNQLLSCIIDAIDFSTDVDPRSLDLLNVSIRKIRKDNFRPGIHHDGMNIGVVHRPYEGMLYRSNFHC